MQAVKAYFDGKVFVPRTPISAKKNREVIVTFLDEEPILTEQNELDNDDWRKCIGTLSDEDCNEMLAIIEEGCEKVDPSEW